MSAPKEVENCVFIDSPIDLTSIALSISEALKLGCDVVFIDAITTLLIYNSPASVIKFSNSVLTKARVNHSKVISVSLKEDEKSELIKNIYEFA